MKRLASTIRKDMIVQSRNNIYTMTLVVALLFAFVFSLLLNPVYLGAIIPAALLFIVGGTTMVFVALLISSEKELGILNALTVTPLRTREYLISKIASITLLATLEVVIMIGIPLVLAYYRVGLLLPNFFWLLLGVFMINLMYSMLGVGLGVRFEKFTDFMFPAVVVIVFLQVPAVYYAGIIDSKLLLVFPSAGPVMLVYGAFNPLKVWEYSYGIGYSLVMLVALAWWCYRSYLKHIGEKLT